MNEWSQYSKKHLRHPNNKEFVTGRVNIRNNRKVIRISVGLIVCELVKFNVKDRVTVSVHKNDKHMILISKDNSAQSYQLTGLNNRYDNFLAVTFRYDFNEPFRLSQTILLDFDVNDEGILIVDLLKLKWRE